MLGLSCRLQSSMPTNSFQRTVPGKPSPVVELKRYSFSAMIRSREDYEKEVLALVGKQLKDVVYYELRYELDTPLYSCYPQVGHILDFGCDLRTTDGDVFGLIWDGEFFQYGVGITRCSLSHQLADPRIWDATREAEWTPLIGQTITGVKVYWSWVQYEGELERHYYPQDVELKFGNGFLVYISSSQYSDEKDALWGASDDIAIIFGSESAERYGVGPFAEYR
jgi:hypothetical protein